MMKKLLAVGFVLILTAAAAAQSGAPAPSSTGPIEALLAEVRALRADLQQNSSAAVRAQLLVARVQLQEQRINSSSRDLLEVQRQLAGMVQARVDMVRRIQDFEGPPPAEVSAQDWRAVSLQYRAQLQEHNQREQVLRQQESALIGAIAEDQARWTDFNNRLDQLERSLAGAR